MLTAVAAILTAVGGLLVALHQVGLLGGARPPAAAAASSAALSSEPVAPASPAVQGAPVQPRYQVALPNGSSVVLSNNRGEGTYQVLAATAERRTADVLTLKLSIRLTNAGPSDIGFWTDSFRLLIDKVPRAPSNWLNSSVDARSAKEADIVFEVPAAARSLELKISSGDETGSIPLVLSPAPGR